MSRAGTWAMGVALLLATGDARADACMDAPVQGQKLQRSGKLMAARDKFALCAQKSCPGEIVRDCTGWMQDVSKAIPSVVAAARDSSGADVLDASLSIDGGAAAPIGARAVELDPGSHHLVFHRSGAPDFVRDLVLHEGEKDRQIVATFAGASPRTAPASPVASTEPESAAPSRPIPVGAWVAGGVGAAALVTFGAFGTIGVVSRGGDHCDSGCSASQKSGVDTDFLIADVSLAVSIVALGVATWSDLSRETVPAPVTAVLGVLGAPVPF